MNEDENAAPAYQGHAWADAFGIWFARVPRNCVSPLIVARRLLREELTARDAHCHRDVWLKPVRMYTMDTVDTVVYMEGVPPGIVAE